MPKNPSINPTIHPSIYPSAKSKPKNKICHKHKRVTPQSIPQSINQAHTPYPSTTHYSTCHRPYTLNSLPPPIINIHLQLPTNHTRNTMTQPDRSQKGIIPLLIQEQLSRMPEPRVYFAVFIDVGSYHPGAGGVVEVVDCAFADVDKEADVLLASVCLG